MKHILILADGAIARHFVTWVGRKRVADNRYIVTCFREDATPEKLGTHMTRIQADPTSFARIKRIMDEVRFSQVFIVMENKEEAYYALKNVRMIDEKILVVLVDQWDDGKIGRDENNVVVLNSAEVIAAHLYDHLPNVPVIAQNVGLGKGEVMEVLVPFGSAYAYRHVGSILQRKWRIAALYRNEKLILPTNATMIRPNDTLLIVGKPMVLEGIYRTVNKRMGLFPEPYGKHIYLIVDFRYDTKRLDAYIEQIETVMACNDDTRLIIRVLNPNDFALLERLKDRQNERIDVEVNYTEENIAALIEYDIQEHDVGWVFISPKSYAQATICEALWHARKVVTIFGQTPLSSLGKAIVLMDTKEKMESISSTAFDAADSLSLALCLCDFDPEGAFDEHQMVVEHYETLAQIFNKPIEVVREVANPIRRIRAMQGVLQIMPFEERMCRRRMRDFFGIGVTHWVLRETRHPKLLVPFVPFMTAEGNAEAL